VTDVLAVTGLLCESGHLEVSEERKHRNQTTTVTYTILSLDPEGTRPEPTAVPALLPDFDETEPELAVFDGE